MDIPTDSPLHIYLGLLLAPFVQEDIAVVAAAAFAIQNIGKPHILFICICVGLFFSDIWKYWIGWGALRHDRIKSWTEKKHVAEMQERVRQNPIKTLFTARFVPLTRIPCYVACGFSGVPYLKFCLIVGLTAVIYVCVIFALFYAVGEILGEKLLWILPVIAVTVLISFFIYQKFIKKSSEHG